MSNTQSDESPDKEAVFPFVTNSLNDRGQTRVCKNLLEICLNQKSVHANQNSPI